MTTPNNLKEEANKDATTSAYRVTVLYGDYGKRKTTTACSLVNERGLLLSSDDSWKVLLNDRHKELYSKLKVVKLTGLSQLKYIEFEGYDTIIWDTFSKSVDDYLDLLYDEASWGGNLRMPLISKNPDLKGISALGAADYRVTRDSFRPTLNRLLNTVQSHVIFTSQATNPIEGLSKNMTTRPQVPEQTFKVVGTRADIIANIRPGSKGFVVDVTENSLAYMGKSRIEGIQGQMDLDKFVTTYKEIVF